MKQIYFRSIDSTNTFLKKHYHEFSDLTFVRSDYQSQGKGRKMRRWLSEPGESLMFSLLIKDEQIMKDYACLSILSAYSLIEVLEDYRIGGLMIKWPNDVYHLDEKLCGILLESISTDKMECVIIGMGVNVSQQEFLGEYRHKPCSIQTISNKKILIDELQDLLYKKLLSNIELLKNGHDFYEEIRKYDYLAGKEAYGQIGGEQTAFRIIGIDADYSLKVRKDEKELSLSAGEITLEGDIL